MLVIYENNDRRIEVIEVEINILVIVKEKVGNWGYGGWERSNKKNFFVFLIFIFYGRLEKLILWKIRLLVIVLVLCKKRI